MSENTGSAAEAFEALREEVAKLRNGVERIYRQGREVKPAAPPKDYDLPLSNMERRLGAIEANLANMKWEVPLMLDLPGERIPPDELIAIRPEVTERPFFPHKRFLRVSEKLLFEISVHFVNLKWCYTPDIVGFSRSI